MERKTEKIHVTFMIYSDCHKVQVVCDSTPIYQINLDLMMQVPLEDRNFFGVFDKKYCLYKARQWLAEFIKDYSLEGERGGGRA